MPIYEYRCTGCGGEFEYRQRMSDAPRSLCESCGGTLEKLISRSSFLLKGSGWYKDLYSSPRPEQAKSGSSDDAAKKSDSGSKESSPAGSSQSSPSSSSSSGGSSSTGSSGSSATSSGAAAS